MGERSYFLIAGTVRTRTNQSNPSPSIPQNRLLKLKAQRCTVTLRPEPFGIAVEGAHDKDRSMLSEYLKADETLLTLSDGSAISETGMAQFAARLEALSKELGFTLVLPESAADGSRAASTSQDEAISSSRRPTKASNTAKSDDDNRVLNSWEDCLSEDERDTAGQL